MIIIEVGRGLGDSMHVYAAGKALAEYNKTELKIDTSYLDAWPRPNHKFEGVWDVVIEKFIELDKDDNKYLKMANKSWLKNNKIYSIFKKKENELIKSSEKIVKNVK